MESCTIQVTNVNESITEDKIEEIFSEFGPLKRFFIVRRTQKAIVQYASNDYVSKLLEDTNGQIKCEDENVLKFESIPDEKPTKVPNKPQKDLEQRRFDLKAAKEKKSRLIVRNLSFKATDEKLKSHFSTYGDVTEVNILKKKDGKMVGCAFVQYANVKEASKALKELNGKAFLQRPIAIDWAVPKEKFQQNNPKKEQEIKEEGEDEEMEETEVKNEPVEVKEENESDGGDDKDDESQHDDEEDDDDDDHDDEGGSDQESAETPPKKVSYDSIPGKSSENS